MTITSGLTANSKLYDGTTSATLSSNSVVLAGVVAADAGNVALSTNGYTAAFASAAPGASQSVTVSGLSLTGSAAADYSLTQPVLTASIAAPAAPFTYTIDNGAITLTGYLGPGGAVAIPSEINGLPVTSIGTNAFSSSTNLTSITIPNSVTGLQYNAFGACSSLTNVTLGNSATSIGDEAFAGCTSLASVTIPNSVTYLGASAFENCTSLASVTIGNSVTTIGDEAFTDCGNLGSVTIGNSVTYIGVAAFEGCSLGSITIPSSVTTIVGLAFGYDDGLTNVYFLGNEPSFAGELPFYQAHPTAYYLPGTTGWGTTLDIASGAPLYRIYTAPITLPAITLQPQSQTISAGDNATFTVTATSVAPLSYQWLLNGAAIGGATATNYTIIQPQQRGSYSVVVSNFAGSVASAAALLTVQGPSPATVTIVSGVTANSKVYDGTTCATLSSNNVVLAGVLAGDAGNVALSTNGYTAAFAGAAPGIGQSVTVSGLSLTGSAAGNYALTQPILAANITGAPLLVSADDQARAFGHTNPVWTVSYRGFVGGDGPSSLGGSLSFSFTDTNAVSMPSIETNTTVGTYVIIPGGLTSGTYALSYADGTLQITQAVLTVAVNPAAKVYGTANPAFSATISGFLDSDNASVVSGTPQLSTSAGAASSAGVYDVVGALGTLSATNYSFSFTNGTLTVLPAPLTVIGNNATRLYGAANPPFTGTIAGLQNGDLISASFVALAGPTSPVGDYGITASLSGAASTMDNYTLSITLGTLQVLPAPLTITANNAARLYGATNPPFTGTITGVQNGDNVTATYSCSAGPASAPGAYPIVPAPASPGNLQTNYQVTLLDGTLTIVAPPLLQAVAQSNGTITLSWSATAGQSYQVQYTSDLTQPDWTDLVIITATNSTATASDALSSSAQRFYRTLWSP